MVGVEGVVMAGESRDVGRVDVWWGLKWFKRDTKRTYTQMKPQDRNCLKPKYSFNFE